MNYSALGSLLGISIFILYFGYYVIAAAFAFLLFKMCKKIKSYLARTVIKSIIIGCLFTPVGLTKGGLPLPLLLVMAGKSFLPSIFQESILKAILFVAVAVLLLFFAFIIVKKPAATG